MAWQSDYRATRVWDERRRLELKVEYNRHTTEFWINNGDRTLVSFRAYKIRITKAPSAETPVHILWGVTDDSGLDITSRRELICEALAAYKNFYGLVELGCEVADVDVVFDVEAEPGV